MDVEIAIGPPQHRVEANLDLGRGLMLAHDLVRAGAKARVERVEIVRRHDDRRHDASVGVALEVVGARRATTRTRRVSNTTTRGRLRSATPMRLSMSWRRTSGTPSSVSHRCTSSGGPRSSGENRIALVVATLCGNQR